MSENKNADREDISYLEDAMDRENRTIREKAIFPSASTFKGRMFDEWDMNDRKDNIEDCDDKLIISHTDADGFVSAALLLDAFENSTILNIDYEHIEEIFKHINENLGDIEEIYVTDLNLDEVYPSIEKISNKVDKFVWLDHHEWGEKEEKLRNMGVNITIDQDHCAAGIVLNYLQQQENYEPTETAIETVNLTEDHDLWKHEMEKIEFAGQKICISKIFSQLAFYASNKKYMENILDYGRNFMEHEDELLGDKKDAGYLEEKELESQKKLQYILENQIEIKNIGEYKVAFAYGRTSPGELLEELKEKSNIDILAHIKPAYPVKISFRSTESFKKCHKIAEKLGGGGHEQAAGAKPNMCKNLMDFIEYLYKEGKPVKNKVEKTLQNNIENKNT